MWRYTIVIISLSCILAACEEYPREYTGVITGKISNYNGFPLIVAFQEEFLGVSSDQYSALAPDFYGNFYLDNVVSPYDLYVKYTSLGYSNRNLLFIGLRASDLRIIYPEVRFESRYRISYLTVKFPAIRKGKIGFLKFISPELFQSNDMQLSQFDSAKSLQIKFTQDITNIQGKIIFFQCTPSDSGHIQSYDNFGVKNISIHEGSNGFLVLTPEDIIYDPGESSVNVNVEISPKAEEPVTQVLIHFPGMNPYSDVYISDAAGSGSSTVTVPADLKVSFKIEVRNSCLIYSQNYGLIGRQTKSILLNPGANGVLDNSQLVPLIYPADEQGNVSDTVILRYGDNNPGIYQIYLSGYTIYTDKNNMELGELKSKGLTFSPGQHIRWSVIKYSNFVNIDQFVTSPYIFQENFDAITFSDKWLFVMSE